jgi:hypothetical protein
MIQLFTKIFGEAMTRSAFLGVQICKLSSVTLMLFIATTSSTYAQAPEAGNSQPENASSPLAKVRNTDIKLRLFDLDGFDREEYVVEGGLMLTPKLKFRYEAHYWQTDITGRDTSGMESVRAKAIFFPGESIWRETPYRLAAGIEVKVQFDNQDKGIGQDSDTILPFVGIALVPRPGTTIIPLLQHETEISGEEVNNTSFRLLALQTLPRNTWLKLDAIVAVNWENDRQTPSFAELQYGHQFPRSAAV